MGDFFQISTSSISFLLASMTTLISNAMPVILPLLALIIGAWIFERVTSVVVGKSREEWKELGEKISAQMEERERLTNPKYRVYTDEELYPEDFD